MKGTLFKSAALALAVSASTAFADATPKQLMIDGLDARIKTLEVMPYSPFLGDRLNYTFDDFELFDDNGSYGLKGFKVQKGNEPSPVFSFDSYEVAHGGQDGLRSVHIDGLKLDFRQLVESDTHLQVIQYLVDKLNQAGGVDIVASIREGENDQLRYMQDITFNGLFTIRMVTHVEHAANYTIGTLSGLSINPAEYQILFDHLLDGFNPTQAEIVIEDAGIVDKLVEGYNSQQIFDLKGSVSESTLSDMTLDRNAMAGLLRIMQLQMLKTAVEGHNGYGPFPDFDQAKLEWLNSTFNQVIHFVQSGKPIRFNPTFDHPDMRTLVEQLSQDAVQALKLFKTQ
jgi:hypothetical protein